MSPIGCNRQDRQEKVTLGTTLSSSHYREQETRPWKMHALCTQRVSGQGQARAQVSRHPISPLSPPYSAAQLCVLPGTLSYQVNQGASQGLRSADEKASLTLREKEPVAVILFLKAHKRHALACQAPVCPSLWHWDRVYCMGQAHSDRLLQHEKAQ